MHEIKSVITTSRSKIVTLMTFFHTLTAFLTQSTFALVLPEYRQLMVEDMKKSDQEKYRNLGRQNILLIFYFNNILTFSGKRTISPDHILKKQKLIWDKVLKDERTHAYATTIDDINTYFSHCEFCTWYKSDDTVVSEARF